MLKILLEGEITVKMISNFTLCFVPPLVGADDWTCGTMTHIYSTGCVLTIEQETGTTTLLTTR